MKEPIGGLVSSREVTAEYRPTMTDIEQAIYAATYSAIMGRFFASTAWALNRSVRDDEAEERERQAWIGERVGHAKEGARLAVELHRGGE